MTSTAAQGRRTDATLVVTNVLWNAAASLIGSVIAFLLVPFLLHRLGEAVYGVWALVGSVFAYAVVFQLGLVSAINRYIPVKLASGDVQGLRAVVSTCAAFLLGVGVVVLLLTLGLHAWLTQIFQIPPALVADARETVLVVGGCTAVTIVTSAASAVLSGYQRYDLMAGSRIAVTLARTAVLVWLVVQGHGLVTVALVYGLSELLVNAIYLGLCVRLLPERPLSSRAVDGDLLREMLGYGFNTFNYILGALLLLKAGEVLIGIYRSAEEVAHYAIVTASVLTLTTVIEAFCAAIKPAASDLDASDDHARLRELTLLSQKYSLFMILPSAAFLLVMGREFLLIWTHKDIPLLPTVLAIVVAGHAFRLAQHSSFFVLVGKGEHRFFGRLMVTMAAGTVGLGWASLAVLDWGLLGIAWSSAIPLVIGCGILLPRHVYRQLGIGWSESLRRVWLPSLGGALPGVLLLVAWKLTMPPRSWPELLLVVFAVAATTLLAAWRLGLGESERVRFWSLARQGWSRVFA
ncbi:MAG: oligosaccharide flippase family protein [Myxococcota bacterium]